MAYSRPGVYISETLLPSPINAGGSANAAGAVAAPFAKGPETVTKVNTWFEFVKYFGGYSAAYPSTFGVASFFNNGGSELYVKRILASDAEAASVNIMTSASDMVVAVTAKNRGEDGNNLRVTIAAGTVASTYTLTVYRENVVNTASDVSNDILLERYENIVFNDEDSSDFADTVINLLSSFITVESVVGSGVPVSTVYPLTGGDDGTTVVAADYTAYNGGSTSVFEEFTAIDRPLVLFLPEINKVLSSSIAAVYNSAISWAAEYDSFVIAETAADLTSANAKTFASSLTASSHTAVYFPHLFIVDPVGRSGSAIRKVGPSGAIAGLYISTDRSRGVFKAPAGLNLPLGSVVGVEKNFTSNELDSLNTGINPVNPIRQVPGAGIVVMGARTLKQDGTANKYVNMRRSLIYIRRQLKAKTEFAIFENNDEKLWSELRTVITVFLNEYRNQGGLRGTLSDAFFVLCDGTNNTAQQIVNGEVHIQVGVALQYPAEFIVIDLSQKTLN